MGIADADEEQGGESIEMRPINTGVSTLGEHELQEIDSSHNLAYGKAETVWRKERRDSGL